MLFLTYRSYLNNYKIIILLVIYEILDEDLYDLLIKLNSFFALLSEQMSSKINNYLTNLYALFYLST